VRKSLGSFAAFCAAILVAVGISACGGGGVPSNAVATVNGKSITKSTLTHWLGVTSESRTASTKSKKAEAPVVPQPPHYTACIARLRENEGTPAKGAKAKSESELRTACKEIYEAAKTEAMSFLINAEWVIAEAAARKVSVTNKAVYAELAKLKKADYPKEAEFKELLLRSGQTVSDVALRVKLELLEHKIEAQVLKQAKKKPSKAEIEKYYEKHKSTYGTPETRNLNIVLVKTEAQANSAKSEIEGGKSFASVAKAVSIESASKSKGGVLEGVEKGQEQKALSQAVFSASMNKLTGPIKTPFGYYVFEVTKVTKATQKPLKSVETEVTAALTSEREQTADTKFTADYKKKWKPKTQCASGYVVETCSNYKKPKKKTSTTSSSSSTK
jgi:foldase protein PrsA